MKNWWNSTIIKLAMAFLTKIGNNERHIDISCTKRCYWLLWMGLFSTDNKKLSFNKTMSSSAFFCLKYMQQVKLSHRLTAIKLRRHLLKNLAKYQSQGRDELHFLRGFPLTGCNRRDMQTVWKKVYPWGRKDRMKSSQARGSKKEAQWVQN